MSASNGTHSHRRDFNRMKIKKFVSISNSIQLNWSITLFRLVFVFHHENFKNVSLFVFCHPFNELTSQYKLINEMSERARYVVFQNRYCFRMILGRGLSQHQKFAVCLLLS